MDDWNLLKHLKIPIQLNLCSLFLYCEYAENIYLDRKFIFNIKMLFETKSLKTSYKSL